MLIGILGVFERNEKFTRWYASDRDSTNAHLDMSNSKPEENASKAQEKPKSDDIPHLGVLEEDDEFEEFECAGEPCALRVRSNLG